MYSIYYKGQFKKDSKKFQRNVKQIEKIEKCIELLKIGGFEELPLRMKPHLLKGNYQGFYECHIEPDLLMIWKQEDQAKKITLIRLGTHSHLFN